MRKNIKTTKKTAQNFCLTMADIKATEKRSDSFAYRQLAGKEDIVAWSCAAIIEDRLKGGVVYAR